MLSTVRWDDLIGDTWAATPNTCDNFDSSALLAFPFRHSTMAYRSGVKMEPWKSLLIFLEVNPKEIRNKTKEITYFFRFVRSMC